MNYEKAYYYFFNHTTDLINLLTAGVDNGEKFNIVMCLHDMQAKAEECCIAGNE